MLLNAEQIINGLNNNTSFSISIICNIKGTNEILLTKLAYNPYGEKLILIEEMNKNATKLSEILNEKNKAEDSDLSYFEEGMNPFIKESNSVKLKKYIDAQTGRVFKETDEEIKRESYASLSQSGINKPESKDKQVLTLKKARK